MIVTGASLAEARRLAATPEFRDAVKLATRLELAKKQFGGIQNVLQEVHVATILGEAVFYTDNGAGTFSTNIGVDCSTLTARCQIALDQLGQILADPVTRQTLLNKVNWFVGAFAGISSRNIVNLVDGAWYQFTDADFLTNLMGTLL